MYNMRIIDKLQKLNQSQNYKGVLEITMYSLVPIGPMYAYNTHNLQLFIGAVCILLSTHLSVCLSIYPSIYMYRY